MPLPLLLGLPPVDTPEPSIRQVIVVSAPRWHTSRAVLQRFEVVGGHWQRTGRPTGAWLGRHGLAVAANRRQNSGRTPAGVFTVPRAFGAVPGTAVRLPYHRITPTSYWPYDPRDPRTYNVLQTSRRPAARWRDDGQWSERLADYGRQYRRAVVIGYNLPSQVYLDRRTGEWRAGSPARTGKGGGIFLHVTDGGPTAGCVAVGGPQMRRILTWLDPAAHPRIVIGTRTTTRDWRSMVS